MILGVETCREGSGYCLLGLDCTLDDDFLPDDSSGHCNGLKTAFTPAAHFTCCKVNPERSHVSTTKRPRPLATQTTAIVDRYTNNNSSIEESTVSQTTGTLTYSKDETEEGATDEPQTESGSIVTVSEKDTSLTSDTSTTLEADNSTEPVWGVSDIFVDLNNEVFKEVIPPVLQDTGADLQEQETHGSK